ncbi:hypothetical protein V8D89_013517 [Ganoderma adspersum]
MSQPLRLLSVAGHTPRLQHLELHHVPVAWTDPTFYSTLTTLVVITKAMAPSLVELTLEDSVPQLPSSTTEPPLASGRSIILTSLRTLSVTCNTNDCVHLLDHLSANPTATMRLTGHGAMGIQRLSELLSDHFSCSAPLQRLNVSVTQSTANVIITGYWNAEPDVLKRNNDPAIRLILDISPGEVLSPLLTAILEGANTLFSRVQTMSISLSYHENVDWSRLFTRTPNVAALNVTGPPGQGFFTALSDVRQAQIEEPPSACVPLCQLRKLTLELEDARHESLRVFHRGKGTFFDQLLDWAILRCNYEIPLDILEIWRCKYTRTEDFSRLQQVVAEVKWDGSEQGLQAASGRLGRQLYS